MSELPHVDPRRPRSRSARAYAAVLRTPPGRWTGMYVASRVDPWLMRRTGGRVGMGLMLPSALLTTVGAKSGQERENPVLYFHDGDDVVIIASSFGRDKHPAWFHNLKAHPDVRIGTAGHGQPMHATEVTDDAELLRLWSLADQLYPPYADYRRRTAVAGRRIPIVRLTARSTPGGS